MNIAQQLHSNITKPTSLIYFKIVGLLLAIFVHVYYGTQNFEILKFQKILVATQYGVQLIFIYGGYKIYKNFKETDFNSNKFLKYSLSLYVAFVILMSYYLWENYFTSKIVYTSFKNASIDVVLNLSLLQSIIPKICNGIIPGSWIASCFVLFYLLILLFGYKITSFQNCLKYLIFSILIRFVIVELIIPKISIAYNIDLSYFKYANFLNQLPIFILGVLTYYFSKANFNYKLLATPGIFILMLFYLFQIAYGQILFFPTHFAIALLGVFIFFVFKPLKSLSNNYFFKFILSCFNSNTLVIYFCHFPIIFLLQKMGLFDIFKNTYLSLFLNYVLTIVITLLLSKCITFLITLVNKPCINLKA